MFACSETTNTSKNNDPVSEIGSESIVYPSIPDLDEILNNGIEAMRVPGIQAAIMKEGQVVWANGYGLANTEHEIPVETHTNFMLASISKTVTAVAIMQLYEKGLFSLEDDVNSYLDFKIEHPENEAITFYQLLTHTSSIADDWTVMRMYYSEGDSDFELGEFLSSYLDADGIHYNKNRNFNGSIPGTEYEYSNIAIALVGYLVETISGTPFDTWCNENIFTPLQMNTTSWKLDAMNLNDVANPHEWVEGLEPSPLTHYGYPDYPNGQLRSNVVEMGQFQAMFNGDGIWQGTRILEKSTIDLIKETHPDHRNQGLIWKKVNIYGEEYWGHGGSDLGVHTKMYHRETDGIGHLLFLNASPVTSVDFYQDAIIDAAEFISTQ